MRAVRPPDGLGHHHIAAEVGEDAPGEGAASVGHVEDAVTVEEPI
jgi:hypothetical protein